MIKAQALVDKFNGFLAAHDGYIYATAGEVWTTEKQAKATREQTVKWGSKWIGHKVEDCSGAFTRAFKELGGYMYHGSNTMYRDYCTAKGKLNNGKRDDGKELLPGTAIFTGTENDHGHVGLYIGNGEIIEARGTCYGVVKSNLSDKRWTYWGELKGVDYGESPAPDPDYRPTLRKGDKGEYVTLMQTKLLMRGYDLGKWGADGSFGSQTEAAVRSFQKNNGLTQDGVCGPKTWAVLEDTDTVLFTVTIPHCTKNQAETLVKEYIGATMTEERG